MEFSPVKCSPPVAGLSKSVIENRNSILSQIETNAPNDEKYSLVAKVVHFGVALLVYVWDERFARVEDVQTAGSGCEHAYLGNKGVLSVRFRLVGEDGRLGDTQRIADYN